ncbi:MAG TPA: hypothetical protein V6C58_01550 [Allocoleopsis sp.]
MKKYSHKLQLTKNSRGVYSIDPSIGCSSGTKQSKRGCYDDCYAARIAKLYGYDFTKTVKRNFLNISEIEKIKRQIRKIKLPFVRMGTMGDPSEDWQHTINICKDLQSEIQLKIFQETPKEIVIITKHWNNLTDSQLQEIKGLNICINTSISVLDNSDLLHNSLHQYERIKPYCKSILRVVTCDFNKANELGLHLATLQQDILSKYKILDTVFRPSKNNKLILDGVINVHKTKFLGKTSIVSKLNKKTYFGNCNNCIEMCGVNM